MDKTLYVTQKGGIDEMNIGTKLNIAGIFNDGEGGLQYKNATVIMDGYTLVEQAIANYPSQNGDSGAPIYYNLDDDNVQLVGIHVGKGCNITHVDDRSFAVPGCNAQNKNAIYKVFSPWENVEESLGID